MSRSTATFKIGGSTAEITLTVNTAGVPNIGFRWIAPPLSMNAAERAEFEDRVAEAIEGLMPGAFEPNESTDLAVKVVGHGTLRKVDTGVDSAVSMIRDAHRAGGAPLGKVLPSVVASSETRISHYVDDAQPPEDEEVSVHDDIRNIHLRVDELSRTKAMQARRRLLADPRFGVKPHIVEPQSPGGI